MTLLPNEIYNLPTLASPRTSRTFSPLLSRIRIHQTPPYYDQPQAQPDDYIPNGSMDVQDLSLYELDQESPVTSLPISAYSSLAGWDGK
ncbi:hypothetical protein QCA50_013518 [Cerrena zonata]|uniref:Uncharacterized protein n=1 Tax=Cerrena zonata TaxID=2478898 RepID=A0AAW0FR54_9APHY